MKLDSFLEGIAGFIAASLIWSSVSFYTADGAEFEKDAYEAWQACQEDIDVLKARVDYLESKLLQPKDFGQAEY